MIMQRCRYWTRFPTSRTAKFAMGSREPVPEHRLPEHREGRAPGNGEHPMTITEESPDTT